MFALVFRVGSGENGIGGILQSDISHLQLNILLFVVCRFFNMESKVISKPFGCIRKSRLNYLKNFNGDTRQDAEYFNSIVDKFPNSGGLPWAQLIKSIDWKKFGLRLIFFLVSSAWFAVFPVYLFVLYMYERGFFSYEFFIEGVFGLKAFFLTMVILIVMISVYLYGFLVLSRWAYISYVKSGKLSWDIRVVLWISLALAGFFHLWLFSISLALDNPSLYASFTTMAFILASYACSFIKKSKREGATNWIPSAVFLFVSFSLPIFNTDSVAMALETGLKNFNVGGGKSVVVFDNENKETVKGSLLLWAPEFVYIESSKEGKRLIHAYPTKYGAHVMVEQ